MIAHEFRTMVRALMVNAEGRTIPLEIAALGLVGEVGEFYGELDALDHDDLLREAGDVLWYVVAIEELTQICATRTGQFDSLYVNAARVAEMVKKHTWHGKVLDHAAMGDYLGDLLDVIGSELSVRELTLEDAQAATMAKLKKRWPNGFGV
jgi:NTP pyrophosphatase (non-canonical NTP hydrolase)